jgi:hypothetical protein
MIRWASCGLVVLLIGSVGGLQAECCALIRKPVVPVKPNPFGGQPIAVQPKFVPVPGGPDQPVPLPETSGQRPNRPMIVQKGPPKLDRNGDPLPPGAIARYGTARLRHGDIRGMMFTHDGKRLAVGFVNGWVTVWDVASGDVLAPLAGHENIITGLVFTADGKRLVSASHDCTALVWEIPDSPQAVIVPEAAVSGFEEAFQLLGSPDPAQAQRGMDYLYRRPADAVKQIAERLPPIKPTPATKISQLIADLDSEDFPTREAAVKALEQVGGEAGPFLREAAKESPSPEVRRLANELLARIAAPASRPDDLKILRVVEVLEQLRTPEACGILEKWAAGPPGHRTTVEAAAALARLKSKDER